MGSPFKFLDAYGPDDGEFFFGRDDESRELYERLLETNLVLLYGASGTGKTSLVRCGLAQFFGPTDWLPVFIRRENDLNRQLADAIAERRSAAEQPHDLSTAIRQLYLEQFKPIYLIFDQFEELFIQGSLTETDRFFRQLRDFLDSQVQCKILLSMREEYLARLSDYEYLIPELFDNRMRLEKMGPLQLKGVIEQTAEHFDIEIRGKDTVDQMIENLRDPRGEVELANLQIYLDRLYREDVQRQSKDGERRPVRIDAGLAAATAGLEDILGAFLEEQLHVLESEVANRSGGFRELPMKMLFALVTEDGTKRLRHSDKLKSELQTQNDYPPELVDYCIERLRELRLIKILGTQPS